MSEVKRWAARRIDRRVAEGWLQALGVCPVVLRETRRRLRSDWGRRRAALFEQCAERTVVEMAAFGVPVEAPWFEEWASVMAAYCVVWGDAAPRRAVCRAVAAGRVADAAEAVQEMWDQLDEGRVDGEPFGLTLA